MAPFKRVIELGEIKNVKSILCQKYFWGMSNYFTTCLALLQKVYIYIMTIS